jgi:hypothetical protein
MIRRSFVLGAASVSLALAACSGGGSDPSPSPTPSPTSSPSPTPTASPTYTAFPLAAAQEFGTINAFTSFTGELATGPVVLGPAGTEIGSTRFRLAILADPTAASTAVPQVVRENTEETRFVAADLTVPPATAVNEYVFATTPTAAGAFSTAVFLNNTVATKVTADAGLALTRVSYAGWTRADAPAAPTPRTTRITYGVWGYPTISTDFPTSGTVTYSARIGGRAVQVTGATGAITNLGGTVTITVNFATGLVTVTANVTTIGAGGVETPYGSFSGNGAMASGATQFTGSFGPTSPIPGTFAGSFFGSQAEQIGITVSGSGTVGAADTRLVAAVVGKKN